MLPTIPADKANHAVYGAAIFIVVGLAFVLAGYGAHARPLGLAAAAGAGLIKEGRDWLANRRAARAGAPLSHAVSGADFLATTAGAAVCWVGALATGG